MSKFKNSIREKDLSSRKIFFNEFEHKYTDDLDNVYTSVTQLIDNYEEAFDTKGMAKAVIRKKDSKYYRWTASAVIKDWNKLRDTACNKGNKKHSYMETAIKESTGYNTYYDSKSGNTYIKDMLYTIDTILKKHSYGEVNLEYFIKKGVRDKYPTIYNIIANLVNKGYKIYAEIGVYNYNYLISGLIDVLAIKDNNFAIVDWKTNIDKLNYESGYFKKDSKGVRTNNWIATNQYMKYPIHFLQQSHGNTYSLQLSLYANLVERFGFVCKAIILCHIRDTDNGEVVELYPMEYMKTYVEAMLEDYHKKRKKKINKQSKLQFN